MTQDSDWITVGQAAKLSGYNEEHVRRLLREGLVNGRKFGIVWQVSRTSILEYLSKAESSEDGRLGPKRQLPDF